MYSFVRLCMGVLVLLDMGIGTDSTDLGYGIGPLVGRNFYDGGEKGWIGFE